MNGQQEEAGEVDNMEELFRRNVLDVLGDENDHGTVKPDTRSGMAYHTARE